MDREAAEKEARGGVPRHDLPRFYIPASASLAHLRVQTLKQGDTFAVFNDYGDIETWERCPLGLFHEDTRHLSHLGLQINGRRPLLLSSNVRDDNAMLAVDLTNPDINDDGRLVMEKDTIHVHRAKYLWNGVCRERIAIRNYDDRTHAVATTLQFEADFADLFEVRGRRRLRHGERSAGEVSERTVALGYAGIDGIARATILCFDPAPTRLDAAQAVFAFVIGPGQRKTFFVSVACTAAAADDRPSRSFFISLRAARRAHRACEAGSATVETSDTVFNEMMCRSVADLYMLLSSTDEGLYPYAGVPWFSAPFGRDGLITAMQTLWLDPKIAKGVLGYLAATQATELDPAADAEPGKILHETRKGEMARLGEVPFRRYYGSVDATPLFVLLAGLYFQRTGDTATIERLWPNIEAALAWIDSYGDLDGDGLVEYARKTGDGLVNQGWKDSHDSIFHADGNTALAPIALCEVQGYVYAAKGLAADMARALGMAMVAATLETGANALREKFEATFWCEDLGTYALALDGRKRPCRVRTSNAGHALFAGIASAERAARVATTLTGRDGFSGWGVRTVARTEARYNPMSYHNGSVWPHDNALIALGMARYGLKQPALQILSGLYEAATYMDLRRLPELFCGFFRRHRKGPTFYPVACSPQAWASAAPFALLQACLGLELDHAADEIRFNTPRLPDFLDRVTIRNLGLGETTVDVALRRHENDVAVTVVTRRGSARVVATS